MFPECAKHQFRSFKDVVKAVESRDCDRAVIPVENSIAGRVADVHQMMLTLPLEITKEYLLTIAHALIAPVGTDVTLDLVKTIRSHPQALLQCRTFIEEHCPQAELIETSDTASAVRQICELNDPEHLAIGSLAAAKYFGARLVRESIANEPDNMTRFLVMARPEDVPVNESPDLTSLVIQVDHTPGSLIRALEAFHETEINLTKLETYMFSKQTRNPTFYVDAGAGINDQRMKDCLNRLQSCALSVKFLGSYQASPKRKADLGFLPILKEKEE